MSDTRVITVDTRWPHPCHLVIGRPDSPADVGLDDPSISVLHAQLSYLAGGLVTVQDLNSATGTWLNGGAKLARGERRPISLRGDHRLRVGDVELTVRLIA
jgi:pSer/pThr/pTyr-binding forkhead associated (FHA) protein